MTFERLYTENWARAYIAGAPISSGATSMTVDDGTKFPDGKTAYTLHNPNEDPNLETTIKEIVFGTRVLNTITLTRGQDGTTAVAWGLGTSVNIYPVNANFSKLNDGVEEISTVPGNEIIIPINADEFTIWDSLTGFLRKKVTRENIKFTLEAYFSGLYIALTGAQTIAGVKTFSSGIITNVTGNVSGNAGSVTNGVYTTGAQTIGGVKTFSDDIIVPDEAYDATSWDGNNEVPTKNAIRDKIESISGGGGRTYLVLGSDFSTTSGTAVDITGLGFTPIASQVYMIEACFMTSCATGGNGVRAGISRPTGYDHGASYMHGYSLATATALRYTTAGANENTGAPNSPTGTAISEIRSMLVTGATPSGDFKHTVLSETGGTSVTIKRGSRMRYRTL